MKAYAEQVYAQLQSLPETLEWNKLKVNLFYSKLI